MRENKCPRAAPTAGGMGQPSIERLDTLDYFLGMAEHAEVAA